VPNLLLCNDRDRLLMDNGRWLFRQGLVRQGYIPVGYGCDVTTVDVTEAIAEYRPDIVVVWPRNEWLYNEYSDLTLTPEMAFRNWLLNCSVVW